MVFSYPQLNSFSLGRYRSMLVLHLITRPNLIWNFMAILTWPSFLRFFHAPAFTLLLHLAIPHHGRRGLRGVRSRADRDDSVLTPFPNPLKRSKQRAAQLLITGLVLSPSVELDILPELKDIRISAPKANLDYELLIQTLHRRRTGTGAAKLQLFHLRKKLKNSNLTNLNPNVHGVQKANLLDTETYYRGRPRFQHSLRKRRCRPPCILA